jgi:RNA polymerase sigma-70 factor (sigma-E family)
MHRSTCDQEFSAFVRDRRTQFVHAARLLTAGDAHRAEDLVQIALARLYVAWPRVRGNPVAYVHRIIVNAHIDETRRPRWRREQSVSELPESVSATGSPGDGDDDVWAALAALPPRMRAAVMLRHWLDLSVEESAELLGCTPGTVKSQTAKAITRLRGLLDGPGPVPPQPRIPAAAFERTNR